MALRKPPGPVHAQSDVLKRTRESLTHISIRQVLGGYGYMGEYAVERLWRDAKLLEIGGGTLESHQKNMARELEGLSFE